MTRDEQLKALRQAIYGLDVARENAKKTIIINKLLPIAQACCDSGFKLKAKNNFGESWCDLTFDLNDFGKEFGLDFSIRVNTHNQIELTHGWMSGDTTPIRPYLIQRDKIIARLWDKNDELVACFKEMKQEDNKYYDSRFDIERQIGKLEMEIEQEKTKQALDQLKIGSKWCYEWDKKRPLTITKITEKMVFFERRYNTLSSDNTDRKKITDMISDLKNNHLIPYVEEEKGGN